MYRFLQEITNIFVCGIPRIRTRRSRPCDSNVTQFEFNIKGFLALFLFFCAIDLGGDEVYATFA